MSVLALAVDGVLVEPMTATPIAGAAEALARDATLRTVVCTNQGGPAFRIAGSSRHPSPGEAVEQLDQGLRAVGLYPGRVDLLLVATFPGPGWVGAPADALNAGDIAAREISERLQRRGWAGIVYATHSPGWRTPNPGMLVGAALQLLVSRSAILYVGDQQADQEAAAAAGCRFQWAATWRGETRKALA